MDPRKTFNDRRVRDRKIEEMAYEQALNELKSGEVRRGAMAKALAECNGDEGLARARYLEIAAQSIKDDLYISRRMSEPHNSESKAYGIYSLIVPGLGQLVQSRPLAAIGFFIGAIFLWQFFLGWAIHIWAAFDAHKHSEMMNVTGDS